MAPEHAPAGGGSLPAIVSLMVALPAAPARAADQTAELPGQNEFSRCRRLPRHRSHVKFNFPPNAELQALVAWMSAIGCANLIVPATLLKGKKVTIFAPRNITLDEAYRLFLGALESHGLTVEPQGKFLRIVETARARFRGMPVVADGQPAREADKRYVTRLFRFEYLDPSAVLAQLYNHLRGEKGVGAVSGGSLIATDQAEMLERFAEIVRELDQPALARERLWMLRVKSSSARDMAHRLSEIFEVRQLAGRPGPRASPTPPARTARRQGPARAPSRASMPLAEMLTIEKMIPDDRTNQLIVVAQEPVHDLLLTILQRLDVAPGQTDHDLVHVYPCEHAGCDELAATLSAITGAPLIAAATPRSRPAAARPRGPVVRTPAAPARTASSGRAPATELFGRDVRITFDLGTNSLIVLSSRSDFLSLRRLAEKLDVPRKQVYVEAVILEVLLDKSRDLGVAYHGGGALDLGGQAGTVLGGFDAARTLNPGNLAGDLVGLAGAVFGPALEATATRLLGVTADIPSFGAFIKLLQRNNDVNVVSSPNLLITNNQEGEISVGQRLPFPAGFLPSLGPLGLAGQASGGPGGLLPAVSVQREDVSLRMKLAPSVNERNLIRLDVDVEVSDLAAANFNGWGPPPRDEPPRRRCTAGTSRP